MKFSINREALLKPLSQVVNVVERRQTLPVLSNLLVVAKDDTVTLTGTDLEVELVSVQKATLTDGGEITVPARKLLDIAKALPDGTEMVVEQKEDKITIKAGSSSFRLATLPASEFPVIDDVETRDAITIKTSVLKQCIDATAFAMAHQDVRYYLNGLLLEFSSEKFRCVATDGHRLAICEVDIELNVPETRQIIVPRKGILELTRLLDLDQEEITLNVGRNHLRVNMQDSVFTSKLIEGRFPDYQSVLPVGADKEITISRSDFMDSLQRAAILSNEKYRGVKLEFDTGLIRVSAHNPEQEEAVEEMPVDHQIQDLGVGFNVGYIQEALASLKGEHVALTLKDANSSCLITDPDDSGIRHIIMPLRL